MHHTLEEYLDRYIEAARIGAQPKSPLFRASNGKTGILSERPFDRKDTFAMVQRRANAAGVRTKIGCHTFRATGITPTAGIISRRPSRWRRMRARAQPSSMTGGQMW